MEKVEGTATAREENNDETLRHLNQQDDDSKATPAGTNKGDAEDETVQQTGTQDSNPFKKRLMRSSSVKVNVTELLDVNMGYLVAYVACYSLSVWHTTWALAGNSQTTTVFEVKFEWSEDDTILYNSIISTAGIIGLTIGSFLGGSLLGLGRRKAVMIGQLSGIVGALICMFGTVATLSIGRLFVGVAAGVSNVTFGKSIGENIPEKYSESAAMMLNASICIGLFFCYLMGEILPDPEDIQANRDDELWRVIYIVPAIVGIIVILLVLLIFRDEPVTYCIMNDLEEEGKRHMARVYRKKDLTDAQTIDELIESQFSFQRQSTTLDASSTTFKEAVCGRKYRKASWICFIINCFNQQSGINAINVYANRLLVKMQEGGGEFPLTPRQGTYVIGAVNGLAALLAIWTITLQGRRPIFIQGQFFMAVWLFLCGLSVLEQWNMTAFISINLFITSFQLSQGSTAWLYVPEVCVDSGTGLAVAAQFLNLTLISFTFEFMMNSSLEVHGSIWYFAVLTAIGCLFMICFVRETRGLTDLEKKTLYSPKNVEIEDIMEMTAVANNKSEETK